MYKNEGAQNSEKKKSNVKPNPKWTSQIKKKQDASAAPLCVLESMRVT